MMGYLQYVFNMQLGYDLDNGEYFVLLVYNVFGECILILGIDGFDDNFEQLFYLLDMVYKYYLDFNSIVILCVQNILGEDCEIEFNDMLFRFEICGIGVRLLFKYDF